MLNPHLSSSLSRSYFIIPTGAGGSFYLPGIVTNHGTMSMIFLFSLPFLLPPPPPYPEIVRYTFDSGPKSERP